MSLPGKPALLKDAGSTLTVVKNSITNESLCIQQKVDGQRVLIDCTGDAPVFYNRNGDVITLKGTYSKSFLSYDGFIFDGEFAGGCLWLFDCVEPTVELPLSDRLALLKSLIKETKKIRVLPTAFSTIDKLTLVKATIINRGEGVVIKNLSSKYHWDKRDELKFKFYNDLDAFIISSHPTKSSVEIGVYDNDNNLINVGSVKYERPVVDDQVLVIKYLYATDMHKLYQPSVLCVRKDKTSEQCKLNQLRYTDKSVMDYSKIYELTNA